MSNTLTAVILNDTSTRYHHGCARVVRLLRAGLKAQGITIIATSPARHEWEKDAAFLDAVKQADVIVINGEGTLHHGKPAGEALLRIATHPARGSTPVALINALYQDNPSEWAQYLKACDLISARDSESAAALTRASEKPVRWLPDLSLTAPADTPDLPRHGIIIGDSVKLAARKVLARAAGRLPHVRFIPTKTLRAKIWQSRLARSVLYRVYNGFFPVRIPPFLMPHDETGYLRELASAELHITGRFHAVCLSMLVEAPFLALSSNASKIERLLKDAGMDSSRIIDPQALQNPPASAPFTADEIKAIRAFRQLAIAQADVLFADIAKLAKAGRA